MADRMVPKVMQQTVDDGSFEKDIIQPTEPEYTVPLEQQTQFEVCAAYQPLPLFTADRLNPAMALAQTHGGLWADHASVLGVNGHQLPS
jgi:hypothetical protein